jgi:acyl-CoA thioester hydrolase
MPESETRASYRHHLSIPTRWMDNDIYGHVNNVVYYSFFDTVINEYLITRGGLDIAQGPVIGLAVETQCRFRRPLTFPGTVDAGLRVQHLGTSSVRYEIGLFGEDGGEPAATGYFVHVFVDRESRQPTPIPASIRAALALLLRPAEAIVEHRGTSVASSAVPRRTDGPGRGD